MAETPYAPLELPADDRLALNPFGELKRVETRVTTFPHRHVVLVALYEHAELHLPFNPEQARALGEALIEEAAGLAPNYDGAQN
jgi:hypothetical protein